MKVQVPERLLFLADTTLNYEHKIISRYVPEWCELTEVEGGGVASSLKDKIYGRKIRLRLVAREITTKQPATLVQHTGLDPGTPIKPEIAASELAQLDQSASERRAKSNVTLRSAKIEKIVSWADSVEDVHNAIKHVRLTSSPENPRVVAHQQNARHSEDRYEPPSETVPFALTRFFRRSFGNEVGPRKHNSKTDPWLGRKPDLQYTQAEENYKWLEVHRKYLLSSEGDRKALPTTVPSFPPGRTIVVWELGKAVSKSPRIATMC